MPSYDSIFFQPPAPLAKIALHNPLDGAILTDVPMLLDTGADVSLVPRIYVERLGAFIETEKSFELMSFDGVISITVAAQVDLIFLNRTFTGFYLLTEQE